MFESKYTKPQKAAVLQAGCDRGVKPMRRIVELAAAGQLVYRDPDGVEVTLPAFEIPHSYVSALISGERRKRAGRLVSPVAAMPAADGLAAMRRRLTSVADATIDRLEVAARSKAGADPAEVTRAARMLRELAAVPEPGDGQVPPPAPGKGPAADRTGGTTRHGPGHDILQDHRGSGTAHDAPPIDIPHTHIGDDGQTDHDALSRDTGHRHGDDDNNNDGAHTYDEISAANNATSHENTHAAGVAARAGIAPDRVVVGRPALGLVPAQDGGQGLGIGSRGSVARECPERAICECAREMGLSTPRPPLQRCGTPPASWDSGWWSSESLLVVMHPCRALRCITARRCVVHYGWRWFVASGGSTSVTMRWPVETAAWARSYAKARGVTLVSVVLGALEGLRVQVEGGGRDVPVEAGASFVEQRAGNAPLTPRDIRQIEIRRANARRSG